jgi:hypothetical protein
MITPESLAALSRQPERCAQLLRDWITALGLEAEKALREELAAAPKTLEVPAGKRARQAVRRRLVARVRAEHHLEHNWARLARLVNEHPEYLALELGRASRETVRNDCRALRLN